MFKFAGGEAGASADLALSILETDRDARFIVGSDLRLVWANQLALKLLECEIDLEVIDLTFRLRDRDDHQTLQSYIALGNERGAIPIRWRDGFRIIRIQRLENDEAKRFILTLDGRADGEMVQFAQFDRLYGLTEAEYRITLKMLSGQTADEIAVSSRVSIETVRTHIRRIYVKTSTNSREALLAKLNTFRLS